MTRTGDAAARRGWRAALRLGRRRSHSSTFQGLLESAPDAIVVVDEGGTIRVVNRQTELLFGWDRAELVGQSLEVLLPSRFANRHPRLRDGYFASPRPRPMGAEQDLAAVRRDGTEFPVDISLSPVQTPEGVFVSAAIRDISVRKQAQAQLAHQATHDALTGLPNRVLLADRLEQMLKRSRRNGTSVTAVFLDIDRFKAINDSRGHSAGDALLTSVAHRLDAVVRSSDTVARFGGDEFVVIAEDAELEELGRRLAAAVAQPVRLPDGTELRVSASLGMAVAGLDDDADSLLRDADAAMYEAKERGRDRVLIFDAEMREGATARMRTESDLRRALAHGDELQLWYQPMFDLTSGAPVGVEALLRWEDPGQGFLPPAEVVQVAEETGLIVPLGEWVLRQACLTAASWPERFRALVVSVNLSGRQLLAPGLGDAIAKALADSGLPPQRLSLEIPESVLLGDQPSCSRVLRGLEALGVRLAVDAFGTGFSSLTYLRSFPVDALKIDRSFVQGLGDPESDRADRAIVAGIVDLAHAFGLTTVAEGVESAVQVESLRDLGCEQVQGFHLGRPMPAADLLAALSTGTSPVPGGVRVPEPRPGARRVLVVEDDASVGQLLKALLDDEQDFQVVGQATDGREAIALARYLRPDVVLLDLALPGVGGLEALPMLRTVAPRAHIVVVSGMDAAALRDRATRAGAEAYWDKSEDATGIPEFLRGVLARS
ncbi:MAG: EAL domain-containing protein [Mycobacteriales bacterium]